jgi:hypothetical protein
MQAALPITNDLLEWALYYHGLGWSIIPVNLRTQLLVRICWQLQQAHGEKPFYLSIRKAGQLVDLSHTEAGRRREMLMEDGVLAIASVMKTGADLGLLPEPACSAAAWWRYFWNASSLSVPK